MMQQEKNKIENEKEDVNLTRKMASVGLHNAGY